MPPLLALLPPRQSNLSCYRAWAPHHLRGLFSSITPHVAAAVIPPSAMSTKASSGVPRVVIHFRDSWLCLQHRWKLCRTLASADVMTITDLLFGYPIIFWTAATTAIKTNSPNAGRRPISQGFQGLAADHDGTGERLPS